ncbi:MAG: hypothetical protein R3C58_02220 [Parvularculaceae bacterium]
MVTKQPVIAAIGNFDGVHLGHLRLIDETTAFARALGAAPGVVLFEPHPRRYFRPDDPPFLITTSAQRDRLLRAAGVAEIFPVPFDKALASMNPDAFVRGVLKETLGLAGAVAGEDFRFGAGRAGDGGALMKLGEASGLKIKLAKLLSERPDTEKYGSSAVRDALLRGDVDGAARMLGRPWAVEGEVMEGRKVGRMIGSRRRT